MATMFFVQLVDGESEGSNAFDEARVREILTNKGLFQPGDRIKLVRTKEVPAQPPTPEVLEDLRHSLGVGENDRLVVASMTVHSLELPPPPPEVLSFLLPLLMLGVPTEEDLGCGNPDCPDHGDAVRVAVMLRSLLGDGDCANCPSREHCPDYDGRKDTPIE